MVVECEASLKLGLTNSSLTMAHFLSWVGENVVPGQAEIEASTSNENSALVTTSRVNSFILFFILLIDALFILLNFLSIMKFISWNIRGSNKPCCIYDISKLLIKYSSYIFFIIETKTAVDYWPTFSRKWGRQYNFELVPSNGRSSGLLRVWKPSLSFHIEGKTKHFIWGKLLDPSIKASYHVCGAYGSPKREKKIEFMNDIYSLISQDEPWIIVGDLYLILDESGKMSGNWHSEFESLICMAWEKTSLIDLGLREAHLV